MEINKVDLSGVVPGGAGWEAARAAVTASMVEHGWVVVAHDALATDLWRQALFSRAMPEVFALPLEVKQRMLSDKWKFRGYFPRRSKVPDLDAEGFPIDDAADGDGDAVRAFAEILWPEGNPEFCETMVSIAKTLLKLEMMVQTLVLEGLGVRGESIGAHFDMSYHYLWLWHYSALLDTENSVAMKPHFDDNLATGIVQHEVEGLELLLDGGDDDGRWVPVPAETGTIAFVAGDQFRVLTNGRVPAGRHRVRTPSRRERFSVLSCRRYKLDAVAVKTLEDLVDAEHPLLFNPMRHLDYSNWRDTDEAGKHDDRLKAFCGVHQKEEVVAAGAMA